MDCANLRFAEVGKQVGAATRIMSASVVSEGQPKPYCRVVGYVSPQVMFELHLPVKGWTQRYLQTGCGGLCGNLNVRVGNEEGCAPAEAGELAVASSNMGHQSAGDGAWGAVDPQLRIDFAYRGMHVTALAAKALIEKFYGQRPKYSYFAGCSDGGREALVEAQRYPDDFNGITAGAPALNFITQNTFFHGWNARVNTGADGRAILTAAQLPIFHTAVLAACDAADGVKDGLISDPRLCRFDPAVTQCKPGQDTSTCLSAEQVNVVREIYRGAHTAEGKQLVIGGPMPGSEMAWRGVYVPDSPEQPIMSGNMAGEALLNLAYWNRPAELRSLQDLRFDAATLDSLKPMHAIYDATDPDLSRFAAAGGKLILWHGWSDPHISPLNTIAYYDAVNRQMGPERTQSFVRLYLFPGGYHCAGGEGPFNVGLLQAIMAWVERGRAPYRLVASRFSTPDIGEAPPREVSASDNPAPDRSLPGLESSALVDRTRPVFPYPLVARYAGTGSIDDEANFVAEAPATASKDNFDWLGASFFSPGYEQWCSWKGMSFVCSGSDSQAK
jgi:feruloyl esterase